MSQYSQWQSPTSPYQQRWDGRDQYYNKDDPRTRQHYYPTPPPSARSFSQTTAPRLPPKPQKQHTWPPSPFVEEEARSIAREHTPPVSQDDEVPLRGSQDQQPVILEAGASSDSELSPDGRAENHRRVESSSTDSSGPSTPSESTQNDERRFVWTSKYENGPGDHEKQNENNDEEYERRGSYVRVRNGRPPPEPIRSKSPARPELRINPNLKKEKDPLPYRGPRGSTPYDFTPNSSKPKFPSDYSMSPASMTPKGSQQVPRGRQNELKVENSDRQRTLSSSHAYQDRKAPPPRHLSAMGVPGENARSASAGRNVRSDGMGTPISGIDSQRNRPPFERAPKKKVAPAVESETETDSGTESDISPDERSPLRRRSRRNTQYSVSKADLQQDITALRNESSRKARPEPIQTNARPQTEAKRQDTLRTPRDPLPRSYSSTNLRSPNASHENQQRQRRDTSARSDTGRSPYATPSGSPNPDPSRSYFASPPSSGFVTHPGSKHGSAPNSRPSTPPYHQPQRSGTLDVPKDSPGFQAAHGNAHSQRPPSRSGTSSNVPQVHSKLNSSPLVNDDGRRDTAPRSRHTSPMPSPSADQIRAAEAKLNGYANSAGSKSQTFPLDNGRGRHSRESSMGQPSPIAASFISQTPITEEPPGRKSYESQRSRTSTEVPRSPNVLYKPTLRRAPASRIPSLPGCPRTYIAEGYDDWYTLPGHHYFNICPDCRDALEDSGFTDQFILAPRRQSNKATRCDLSNTWLRMAWLLLIQDRANDRNIINNMTTVLFHEPECPGRALSPRSWHRLFDPDSNRYVGNFDVCPACTKSLENLFPNLRGSLVAVPYPPGQEHRNCDLRTDSHRFAKYVDMLESVSSQASQKRREPDMHRFVQLVRQVVSVRECTRDDQLFNVPWHFPAYAPDFTVCEECYNEVVWPATKAGNEVAGLVSRTLQLPPPAPQGPRGEIIGRSCQLYSLRMREAFREAVAKHDPRRLKDTVAKRVGKERELQIRHREVSRWKDEDRKAEEGSRLIREWARWA